MCKTKKETASWEVDIKQEVFHRTEIRTSLFAWLQSQVGSRPWKAKQRPALGNKARLLPTLSTLIGSKPGKHVHQTLAFPSQLLPGVLILTSFWGCYCQNCEKMESQTFCFDRADEDKPCWCGLVCVVVSVISGPSSVWWVLQLVLVFLRFI